MKITQISVYSVPLNFTCGEFTYSNGRTINHADSTIVRVTTDKGFIGYGEVCPADRAHLSITADEIREHLEVLAPGLIGYDPTKIGLVNYRMDQLLSDSPFAKSPLDIACWDIAGQVADKPIFELLGGRLVQSVAGTCGNSRWQFG